MESLCFEKRKTIFLLRAIIFKAAESLVGSSECREWGTAQHAQ